MDKYPYYDHSAGCTSVYLWDPVIQLMNSQSKARRVFELGCGNGAFADVLINRGYDYTGIDSSGSGVSIARRQNPGSSFDVFDINDDLVGRFGTFPIVLGLEVIEHCMSPVTFVRRFLEVMEPGGLGIISTPYHGYLKNVLIAVTNRFDAHVSPLWEGGHVKFFSKQTLSQLLAENGATDIAITTAGRIPPLAKSMIAVFRK